MNVLLTGEPGIGKTTIIQRTLALLPDFESTGFYTVEMRENGRRIGFDIITLDGKRGILARVSSGTVPRVGKYSVDVRAFETLALPALTSKAGLYVVDEIGRMECFSTRFVARIQELLAGNVRLLATVGAKEGGFLAEVRSRNDVVLLTATADNRDLLPQDIVRLLT